MTRIVLLGDIGDAPDYHAGDEAMAEAAVDELGSRFADLEVVAVSGHPQSTERRYGWSTVPRLGFGAALATDVERDERLEAVLAAARGDATALSPDDPAWRGIGAVAGSAAVVVSGGGNLNSIWPEHIYERAALAQVAALLRKPFVVTGQSIGPQLTDRHRDLVRGLLASAALVGVREESSARLLADLGTPNDLVYRTIDDAAFLESDAADWSPPAPDYVAATFAPHSGIVEQAAYIELLGRALARIVAVTGLDVVLVPHQGSPDPAQRTGDVAFHDTIRDASAMASRIHSLPIGSARMTAAAARGARLVVSSRYHPVVFALSGAVPAVGLCVDAYTSAKIGGAMDNFGVGAFAVSVASLVSHDLEPVIADAWQRAAEVRRHLTPLAASRRDESGAWWDAVARAVRGEPAAHSDRTAAPQLVGGPWHARTSALRDWADSLSLRADADRREAEALRQDVERLQREVDELTVAGALLGAELDAADQDTAVLRASARAAHELAGEPLHRLVARLEDQPTVEALQAELAALRNTKTLRFLRLPRRVYGRMRRLVAGRGRRAKV